MKGLAIDAAGSGLGGGFPEEGADIRAMDNSLAKDFSDFAKDGLKRLIGSGLIARRFLVYQQ